MIYVERPGIKSMNSGTGGSVAYRTVVPAPNYYLQIRTTWATRYDEAYARAAAAIKDFDKLSENWDGDGAPPIAHQSIKQAVALLAELQFDGSIPPPGVAATADGGVMLAWSVPVDRGERHLEIEAILLGDKDVLMVGYSDRAGLVYEGSVRDVDKLAGKIRHFLVTPTLAA